MSSVTAPDIKATIRQFVIDQLLFGQGSVQDDASFLDNGIIDSTGVLELVGFIESTYAIRLANEELVPENLDSLNALARFLENRLKS